MPSLTLDLHTFDPGLAATKPAVLVEKVIEMTERSWTSGADLVVLPEFTWLALEPLISAGQGKKLEAIADLFWNQLLPEIQARLSKAGKAVVLGTAPVRTCEGKLRTRAPIIAEGALLYQDKLHLTPWEQDFEAGDTLSIWTFGGFRIAVIICLDIEIPELSSRLRDRAVDLILCPSATETQLGVERVNRCASARAVELGCYVGISQLTGKATSDLIEMNIGRAALYRPSQAAFRETLRTEETADFEAGDHCLRVRLDHRSLEVMRRMTTETNPANLGQIYAGIIRQIHIA